MAPCLSASLTGAVKGQAVPRAPGGVEGGALKEAFEGVVAEAKQRSNLSMPNIKPIVASAHGVLEKCTLGNTDFVARKGRIDAHGRSHRASATKCGKLQSLPVQLKASYLCAFVAKCQHC